MRLVHSLLIAWLPAMLLSGALQAGPSDSERGRDIHFRGPVFTLSRDTSGHTVQLTIGVNNGQVDVMVNAWTEVIIGRGFTADRSQLKLGDFVEVSGFFTATPGKIVAQQIHVEDRDALDLQGRIEAINGNLFQISGLNFLVYDDSVIRPSGSIASTWSAGPAVGQQARVRAGEDNGSWRIYELEYGPRTVDSESLRLEGVFLGYYDFGNGVTSPNLLMIDVGLRDSKSNQAIGTPVARDQHTIVDGELRPGRVVQIDWVFARTQGNPLLPLALHIVVDANGNNNVFDDSSTDGGPADCELEGTIRALGPRPGGGLQFYIQETPVRLTSETEVNYEDGTGAGAALLADGLEVEVTGVRLQDPARTVQANRILIRREGPAGDEPDDGTDTSSGNGPGSGTETPGGNQPDDGGGSGDVGGTPPGEHDGGDSVDNGGSGTGSDSGAQESTTVEITGTIEALHRLEDLSVDRITVGTSVIDITAKTVIAGGGSDQTDSAVLEIGQTVQVEAVERTDGSMFAKKIEIKD